MSDQYVSSPTQPTVDPSVPPQSQVNTVHSADRVPVQPEVVSAGDVTRYEQLKTEATAAFDDSFKRVKVRDRVFRVHDEVSGMLMLDLSLMSDRKTKDSEKVRILRNFLDGAIHVDDVDDFNDLLRYTQPVIDVNELMDIVQDVVVLVAGSPTEPQ